MDIGEFFQHICQSIKEFFYDCFGDNTDSAGGDLALQATSDWAEFARISNPSILIFRNLDMANEVMITWNKQNSTGFRVAANSVLTLDKVAGLIYAKVADPTTTANINFLVISKRVNLS